MVVSPEETGDDLEETRISPARLGIDQKMPMSWSKQQQLRARNGDSMELP